MAGYLPVLPKMEAPEFIESDIAADYEVGGCCVVLYYVSVCCCWGVCICIAFH